MNLPIHPLAEFFPVSDLCELGASVVWPAGFFPRMLPPSGLALGPWPGSYPVTSDGKVVAVDMPGHVPAHLSLIVYADQATCLLATNGNIRHCGMQD